MLAAFINSFKIPELRKRILFTLGMIFIVRIVDTVPIPGVDPAELERLLERIESEVGGGFLGLIDLFSGGALRRCAVGSLGIMTYISASIILQIMSAMVPALERLAREGEVGRQKLTQYGRYLTIGICCIQGLAMAFTLENPGSLGLPGRIVAHPGWGFRLMAILTLTTGSMLIMWLGEQITEYGVGNGISLIITVGIISRLPDAIYSIGGMFERVGGAIQFSLFHLIGLVGMFLLVTAGTIALTQGQRRIPIHTTRRIVGRKVYEGMNTYMPLRVNYSGVMPVIFAAALLQFPVMVLSRAPRSWTWCGRVASALSRETGIYLLFYGGLILFFSYFWVATQFNPLQIADDLKRTGGYVPGIRPGRPTADFLDKAMTRITFAGALFLTIIAVIPSIMATHFRVPWLVASFFGGTSLLIVVGVALETMRQIESHLLMRHYDGFLSRGRRIRGRR